MIADIISTVLSLIDKVIPDAKQAADAKIKLLELQQSGELQAIEAQSKVVIAEAQGESWLQRNWRPITMITFLAIIVNNYILYPYFSLFSVPVVKLETPPQLWSLMQLCLGGYVVGRSVEKGITQWKS